MFGLVGWGAAISRGRQRCSYNGWAARSSCRSACTSRLNRARTRGLKPATLISARHSGPCGRTFGPCNSKVATWARSWQSTSSSGLGCPRVQTRQPFFWHAASLGTPHTARFKALSPAARTAVYTRHDNLITAGNSTAIWCYVRAKGVKRQAGYRLSDRIARRANACQSRAGVGTECDHRNSGECRL